MPLTQMTPGGRWFAPPGDSNALPVYVPPKQLEAHAKRLIGDGWEPCADPRQDTGLPIAAVVAQQQPTQSATEAALQARLDQLEAMLMRLLTQQGNVATPTEDATSTEERQTQFIAEAAATNDAAREAFGVPAKSSKARTGR